jgi:hypothetical protein
MENANSEITLDVNAIISVDNPDYFTAEQQKDLAALVATGGKLDDALLDAVGACNTDTLHALAALVATTQFQNRVNTIVANDILTTGMAKAWGRIRSILEDDKLHSSAHISAASWVRDTLKDMALGRLGGSTNNLQSLTRDQLQAVLADTRERQNKLLAASDG